MKVSKRIITFFLAIAMLVSLFTFASASSSSGILVDSTSVAAWDSWCAANGVPADDYWARANDLMSRAHIGACDSLNQLHIITDKYDSFSPNVFAVLIEVFRDLFGNSDFIVMYDDELHVWRPYDNNAHLWFVNSRGHFPYYSPFKGGGFDGTPDEYDPDQEEKHRTGQWAEASKFNQTNSSVLWHVASNYELNEFAEQWFDLRNDAHVVKSGNFYWLISSNPDTYRTEVLCDKYGYPYYLPAEGETAINTPNGYYTDVTNQYTDNSTNTNVHVQDGGSALVGSVIDIENGILNTGNGEVLYIDSITHDESTHSYYVDAHDEYNFDITNNNYTTNYRLYRIEYHINYTSITYIGQTEEYDERYELYFQLPDGRSSADLTAEDLEQLSVSFSDVVQYARSADNADMRRLYHFDGNTEDSSYWSYIDGFEWKKGASLTYMDEGTFEGSLYLDETEHEFVITLPASDLAGDYTLQFRYYQSHTVAPVLDSHIKIGDEVILQFNGQSYLDGVGNVICTTSIGTWNELCLMRSGGLFYFYVNGIRVFTCFDTDYHDRYITFHFGSEQQTYKKIDELRFTRGALYGSGDNYTPTSVPHDTNLSLVLPDGSIPIVDEVVYIGDSEHNILSGCNPNLTDWTGESALSQLSSYSSDITWPLSGVSEGIKLFAQDVTITQNVGSITLPESDARSVNLMTGNYDNYYYYYRTGQRGLFLALSHGAGLNADTPYTFTVVLEDGTYSYITFSINASGAITVINSLLTSPIKLAASQLRGYYTTGLNGAVTNNTDLRGILIYSPDQASNIAYMQLVPGNEPEISIDYETAIYDSEDLKNSPVLAVRTNQPITGYQIGGVRPSYPTKGLVYAMVENSRIRSLQQYSGSAWVEVDGRIWTGERWIPYSSFDVFTLQDFYDIIGGSDDDYEYIYTESGFWSWFQKQWNTFMKKIDQIIELLGGESGSDSDDDEDITFKIFLTNIFKTNKNPDDPSNRITEDDLTSVGSILDELRDVFDTGFKIGDIFSIFDGEHWISWFSIDVSSGLDSVNGAATTSDVDEDPFNHHYANDVRDYVNSFKSDRGGEE